MEFKVIEEGAAAATAQPVTATPDASGTSVTFPFTGDATKKWLVKVYLNSAEKASTAIK